MSVEYDSAADHHTHPNGIITAIVGSRFAVALAIHSRVSTSFRRKLGS